MQWSGYPATAAALFMLAGAAQPAIASGQNRDHTFEAPNVARVAQRSAPNLPPAKPGADLRAKERAKDQSSDDSGRKHCPTSGIVLVSRSGDSIFQADTIKVRRGELGNSQTVIRKVFPRAAVAEYPLPQKELSPALKQGVIDVAAYSCEQLLRDPASFRAALEGLNMWLVNEDGSGEPRLTPLRSLDELADGTATGFVGDSRQGDPAAPPRPSDHGTREAASAFLKEEQARLERERGELLEQRAKIERNLKKLCGGRLCRRLADGRTIYRTETYTPPRWYLESGRLAPPELWPH